MSKKGIVIIFTIIIAFIYIVTTVEKELDWTPTFDEIDTKPLGTKIFFEELPTWFQNNNIKKIHTSFYEYHRDVLLDTMTSHSNYISISENYAIDSPSFNTLLSYVAQGNNAFISAENFPFFVKDTLKFHIKKKAVKIGEKRDTLHLTYTKDQLSLVRKLEGPGFYIKDTLIQKELGHTFSIPNEKQINFVAIPYQKGIFYIHTNPEVFTNYQLLASDNNSYINTLISYLPEKNVYFNRTVKQDPNLSDSPLRYILSQPSLTWAWYLGLIGMGIFIVFNSKRRQRIIPIISPITNTTTEFVKTVSNLFYETEDYNNIIQKKIIYFLEHVRSHYHLSTDKLDSDFIYKLAHKSNNSIDEVRLLITMISNMRKNKYTTKTPLINLNKKIEEFYKNQQSN